MSGDKLQKALTVAVLALVVLALVVQQFLPEGESKPPPHSVSSTAPDGRRALRETLVKVGFAPEEWRRSPGALPRGNHVVWMADAPFESEHTRGAPPPERDEKQPELHSGRFDLRAAAHYLGFLDDGGTLVVPWTERTRAFLVDELGLEEFDEAPISEAGGARSARVVRVADGTLVTVHWPAELALPHELLDAGLDAYWLSPRADGTEDAFAALLRVGSGAVVLVADESVWDNEVLGAEGNAELAVRLLEDRLGGGRLLFDEYALGRWEPETALSLAFSESLAPATLHLLALLAAFVWASAWARAFARDPEPIEQLSPLSRARAQANVFARAGRYVLLAQFLRRGELARLARAARLSRAGQEPANAEAVERELDLIAARTQCEGEVAGWRTLLLERRATTDAELEELARDLDRAVVRARGGTRRRSA
ncbi:MAG: hypothetical protein IPJ77_09105 [Planctomycetes bacterium]|nr:hypothetical protein [Planctomycetota bacterium]